jgi:hypothetical protein
MRWIIGIDPSASKATVANAIGWAVLCDGALMQSGELEPDAPYFTRARNWLRTKFKMIYQHDNDPEIFVAVETAYLGQNPNVFLGMIQCQSHLCAATLDSGHIFRHISPMESFKASTGLKQYPLNDKGKRSGTRKPAIKQALMVKYNLPEDTSEHVFDALAICEAVLAEQKREHH